MISDKLKWFYKINLVFILLSILAIINEFYAFLALPVLLILLLLFVFAIDVVMFIIVFFTPFSINLTSLDFGVGISIPTEPLIIVVTLIFFLKIAFEKNFSREVIRHPISIAIIINLIWMAITCLTSEMPVISIKYFLSRFWFVIVFYFLATQLFINFKNIKRFVWIYSIPLLIIIGYTVFNHYQQGFTEKAAHWVMTPFYNDHTAYAAIIALFIPIMGCFIFDKEYKVNINLISAIIFLIFIGAIILSYTRASWVSLAAALLVLLALLFRIKFRIIALVSIILIGLFLKFETQLFMRLEENRQNSSSDLATHVQSASNISTDASNLERINRWKSAIRMFKERPVFGWGPGTYMFQYAPFQHSTEMTLISTNAGDMGNAHSEYIGPLAESGLLGALTFIAIVIAVIYRAIIIYSNTSDKNIRLLVLGILLGLITYFVHGMLNNFLDTDKASVPVWAFIAMITAIDIYHRKDSKV